MQVSLNLFNPSFKAIQLNDEEKRQVSSTLHTMKTKEMSEFQRNILKSDVMDVFIPHIQKEALESDNPKAKSVDLNMKMFDALNSFEDKKDPLGWFLSLLNGTEYKDPKPTIFDILEQKEEEERLAQLESQSKPFDPYASLSYKPQYDLYFDIDESVEYTKKDITARARELQSYFGSQYKFKDILNIVDENPYLVEYGNKDFDDYINEFSEAVDLDKTVIKYAIVAHPELMHFAFESINDKAQEYADISGCRFGYCQNAIVRKPDLMNRRPEVMKHNLDALNFYKTVRGKELIRPEAIFSSLNTKTYYTDAIAFLVANADKEIIKTPIYNEKQLVKHIKDLGVKSYRFIIPENKMTSEFIEFAEDFAMDNFGKDIFEFDVIDPNEYARIKKPVSFRKYIKQNA